PMFYFSFFFLMTPRPPTSTLFPYTTLFRSFAHRASMRGAQLVTPKGRCPEVRIVPASKRRSGDFAAIRIRNSWGDNLHTVISARSEEHTSELQSRRDLVCRLLLEKKKEIKK